MAEIVVPSTDIPNSSRVYHYINGGKYFNAADKNEAELCISLSPSLPKWLNMHRLLLAKVGAVIRDEGMRTVIDFGSGIASEEHIHGAFAADGQPYKVVYSDIDDFVLYASPILLANNPHTRFLRGDLKDPISFLNSSVVQSFIGNSRKVAFTVCGISPFVAPAAFNAILKSLYEWCEEGSLLAVTFECKNPHKTTKNIDTIMNKLESMGAQFHYYTPQESIACIKPWRFLADRPGLIPLQEFLGLPVNYITPEDREGVDMELYIAFLQK